MVNRIQDSRLSDEALAQKIVGLAIEVHRNLGCGFVEPVYTNSLVLELTQAQISFEREKVYAVHYHNVEVGTFRADLVVDNRLIIELKSVEALAVTHSVQLVNYLTAAKIDYGLLLNFGARRLEFKTKTRVYQPHSSAAEPPLLNS